MNTVAIAVLSFVVFCLIGIVVGRVARRKVEAHRQAKAREVEQARRPIWYQLQDETPLPRESHWEIPEFVWPETPVAPGIGEH